MRRREREKKKKTTTTQVCVLIFIANKDVYRAGVLYSPALHLHFSLASVRCEDSQSFIYMHHFVHKTIAAGTKGFSLWIMQLRTQLFSAAWRSATHSYHFLTGTRSGYFFFFPPSQLQRRIVAVLYRTNRKTTLLIKVFIHPLSHLESTAQVFSRVGCGAGANQS